MLYEAFTIYEWSIHIRFINLLRLIFNMASGNFKLGHRLSLEGFNQDVLPYLKEMGLVVENKLGLCWGERNYNGFVLISLAGNTPDLETELNTALVGAYNAIEKAGRRPNPLVDTYSVIRMSWDSKLNEGKGGHVPEGQYEIIGMYSDNNVASQLFPSIAMNEVMDIAKDRTEGVVNKLTSIGKKLSQI